MGRGYVWLDEAVERSDQEEARASALAKRWSALHDDEEQKAFALMADMDEGRGYDYDPYEDCECEYCLVANHNCVTCSLAETDPSHECDESCCSICATSRTLTECASRAADKVEKLKVESERRLEVEIVEEKLARLGARMARPYEHWNEDERLMEYMERERD